jgi:hypothetical protein
MSSSLDDDSKFSGEESCPLVADDIEENTPQNILHRQKHQTWTFYVRSLLNFFYLNFWIFTTGLLIIFIFATMSQIQCQCQTQYTYEKGYETEFRTCCSFSFIIYDAIMLLLPRFIKAPSNCAIVISSSC